MSLEYLRVLETFSYIQCDIRIVNILYYIILYYIILYYIIIITNNHEYVLYSYDHMSK